MSGAAELVGSAGPSLSGMSVLSRSDAIESHTHTHTHTHTYTQSDLHVQITFVSAQDVEPNECGRSFWGWDSK